MSEYVLSMSYGKDSLGCLGAIEKLKLPLDRIVHAEVWATDTIPAELPEVIEFKKHADEIILERYGIKVEHYRADVTFEDVFYTVRGQRKTKNAGKIYGFPFRNGQWCVQKLKMPALKACHDKDAICYLGIAADEPKRFNDLTDKKVSPLVMAGWTEADCKEWCRKNDLLSPIYSMMTRSGCWFCPSQRVNQLRLLRNNYSELWQLMLKWDKDSPLINGKDGHSCNEYERRFDFESKGFKPRGKQFKWEDLDYPQMTLNQIGVADGQRV